MSLKPSPEQIRDLRRRHKLTQEQLANSLYGVRVQQVAAWESGRRGCTPNVWWSMCLIHDKRDLWEELHGEPDKAS